MADFDAMNVGLRRLGGQGEPAGPRPVEARLAGSEFAVEIAVIAER